MDEGSHLVGTGTLVVFSFALSMLAHSPFFSHGLRRFAACMRIATHTSSAPVSLEVNDYYRPRYNLVGKP
jgi:hypothetical protein